MANNDYLTIAGSQVNLSTYDCVIDHCRPYVRGSSPELGFSRIVGKLAALPDAWDGAVVSWSNGASYPGTTYFTGDVTGYTDRYDHEYGWVRSYRALGLRNRAEWIPVTDSNTLSDAARYNLPTNDPSATLSREGRTMGQAILDLLSMQQNVIALTAAGVGNFSSAGYGGQGTAVLGGTRGWTVTSITVAQPGSGYSVAPTVVIAGPCTTQAVYTANVSGGQITSFSMVSAGSGYLSPPAVIISTLPSATVTDLAALTVVPPFPISFAGERLLQSVEGTLQIAHPNHWVYVDVSGNIRFLDQRTFTNNTVTLGTSRWLMPTLTRDITDQYSQLIVRGGLSVSGVTLTLAQQPGSSYTTTWSQGTHASTSTTVATGGLVEDFAGWGGYTTNVAACAAWVPGDFQQLSLQGGQDHGSINTGTETTTTIQITSSNTSLTLAADQLDQTVTGQHAVVVVFSDAVSNVTQSFAARVIANTSMSAGGSCTLTLDQALPSTNYNSYYLYALGSAGNFVWRRYYVVNRNIAAAMQQYFPYPFAFRNSSGSAAVLTMAPVCTVFNGLNQSSVAVAIDPVGGTITTATPTSLIFGSGVITPPTDVQVFLPVANGQLQVQAPYGGGFAGTLFTVEGISRTKVVTVREWTDYSLTTNMQTYANELFSTLQDVIVEGSIPYLGLPTTYLTPGQAISITGATYTTGWESVALPVVAVDIQFQPGPAGTSYVSELHLSNRRQRYSAEMFTRPPVRGQQLGHSSGFGAAYAQGMRQAGAAVAGQSQGGGALDLMGNAGGQDQESDMGGPGSENKYQRGVLHEDKVQKAQHDRRMEREHTAHENYDAATLQRQHFTGDPLEGQRQRHQESQELAGEKSQAHREKQDAYALGSPESGSRQVASPQYTQPPPAEGLAGGWGGMGPAPIEGQSEASGAGGMGPTPGPPTASASGMGGQGPREAEASGGGGMGAAPVQAQAPKPPANQDEIAWGNQIRAAMAFDKPFQAQPNNPFNEAQDTAATPAPTAPQPPAKPAGEQAPPTYSGNLPGGMHETPSE